MENVIAERIKLMKPSATNENNKQKAKLEEEGKEIINLSGGDINVPTPELASFEAIKSICNDYTKYTLSSGIDRLKKAIIKKNDYRYDINQVLVSSGAKNALFNLLGAVCNQGDEFILPAPYWPSYPEQIKLLGGVPRIVKCTDKEHFKLQPELLEKHINENTKALILTSPNNPTGIFYSEKELKKIAEVIEKNNILVIFDQVYSGVTFDEQHFVSINDCAKHIKENIIICSGLSKNYGMTGWRIGWLLGNEKIIAAAAKFQEHSLGAASTISQYAAAKALEEIPETSLVETLEKRRNMVVSFLDRIPELTYCKPKGACYIFPSISSLIGKTIRNEKLATSKQFCELALKYHNILLIPGEAFGLEGHFRLAYGDLTKIDIEIGLEKLKQFVAEFQGA